MIIIKNIRVEDDSNSAKLLADVIIEKKINTIWYSTDIKNKDYLCDERADSFLVALLLFAMSKGEDIKIEDTPVSAKLFSNLMLTFIPALSKAGEKYKKINIIAKTSNENIENLGLNGTGISCGIDSFTSLAEYTSEICPEELRINCVTLFNMGSSGDYGGDEARKLYNKRKERAVEFANKYNFKFLEVDSNISEYINMNFFETHTLRNCSVALALQKMFKNYYYSSGTSVLRFQLNHNNPAPYDTFSLSMISNDNINFYSTGTPYNRIEKTEIVSNYVPSYNYLNVCIMDNENCCKCEKCLRTILGLQALNKLEKYNKVFNIDYINKNNNKNQEFLMEKVFEGVPWYKDIYNLFVLKGIKISKKIKAKSYIKYIIKKVIPRKYYEGLKNAKK